jgi:hypothetical protein
VDPWSVGKARTGGIHCTSLERNGIHGRMRVSVCDGRIDVGESFVIEKITQETFRKVRVFSTCVVFQIFPYDP